MYISAEPFSLNYIRKVQVKEEIQTSSAEGLQPFKSRYDGCRIASG
jgi:hypothetical protein